MYTHRIMDITNQIVKQNRDIDKITADIRWASHHALPPPPFFKYLTSANRTILLSLCLSVWSHTTCIIDYVYCLLSIVEIFRRQST